MNTILPSIVRLFCVFLFCLIPMRVGAAVFSVDVSTSGTKSWETPSTWVSTSGGYPDDPLDIIHFDAVSGQTAVSVDREFVEVGEVSVAAGGGNRLFLGGAGISSTLKIGTFTYSGGSSSTFTFRNGYDNGAFSVEIGALSVGSSSVVEIGQNASTVALTLESFKVTGTSTIAGELRFSGVKGQAPGQNVIELGHVVMNGSGEIAFGGRNNTGGTIKVSSLSSASANARVYAYRNSGNYMGLSGTLEINSTGAASTYAGQLRDTYSSAHSHADAKLAVIKRGAGTQILSGNGNVYTGGTFIEEGILAVTNTEGSGVGQGKVTVSGNGTLAGGGRIELKDNAIEVQSGGTLHPGAHLSEGGATLTISGAETPTGALLSIESGAKLAFRLGSDKIVFTNWHEGGLQLAPSGIVIDAFDIAAGRFTLFEFDSITSEELSLLADQFGAQTLGATFDGWQASFGYSTDGANTLWINVVAVPEPGAAASVMFALLAGAVWRRRFRS